MSIETAMGRAAALEAWIAGRVAPAAPAPTAPAAAPAGTPFAGALAAAGAGPAGPAGPVAGAATSTGGQVPYAQEIEAAAARHGIDPALLKGLIRQESNFDPKAGSPAGARGLTQLMPGTAASVGVTDPTDPAQAIEGGAKYLRQMLDTFDGDVTKALAGYNAGPGAVQRYNGVPPYAETQKYVRVVQEFAAGYRTAPTLATLGSPIL